MSNPVVYYFVISLHVLVCVLLVVVILLQQGRGEGMGAAFGGGSQTVFGSRGPTTFFHYITTGGAAIFVLTSLFLSCAPAGGKKANSVFATPTPGGALTTGSNGAAGAASGMPAESPAAPGATPLQ